MRQSAPVCLALTSLLAITLPVAAASKGLEVVAADTTAVEVAAPQLLTRPVLVVNSTPTARTIREQIYLPPSWRLISPDSLVVLPPETQELRLVCVQVPAQELPGRYVITYGVQDASDGLMRAEIPLAVVVKPVPRARLHVRHVPARLIAGDALTAEFELANTGNAPLELLLEAQSSSGFSVNLSPAAVTLAAGQSAIVRAHIATDMRWPAHESHQLLLRAVDRHTHRELSSVFAATEIFPRSTASGPRYHTVPARLVVRTVGNRKHAAMQLEHAGEGPLRSGSSYRVTYLLRGPYDHERNVFGLRDEYAIGVQGRGLDARAGDQLFSLSPLLEQNRYGRGLRVDLQQGALSSGALWFESRRKYPLLREAGGYIAARSRTMSARAHFLHKESRGRTHALGSVGVTLRPWRASELSSEYALCADTRGGKPVPAFQARLAASWHGQRLNAEKITAAPDFAGYYQNMDITSAALYVQPLRVLRGYATVRRQEHNVRNSRARDTAMRETELLTVWTYVVSPRTEALVEGELLYRRDPLTASVRRWNERSAGLRLRHTQGNWSCTGFARRGLWQDELRHHTVLERFGLSVTFAPYSRHTCGVSFQTGHTGTALGAQRSQIAGINASASPHPRLTLALSWQKSDLGRRDPLESDLFSFDARWEVWRGHVLGLRVRQLDRRRDRGEVGPSFLVSYELPLGMPVGRTSATGALKGRVFAADQSGQPGLSNAIVFLNGKAVATDRKGRFHFPSVTPGTHFLQVDRTSIGMQHVATAKMPLAVQVHGGRTAKQDVGVVCRGTVSGEVVLYGLRDGRSDRGLFVESDQTAEQLPAPENALERLTALAGVTVELRGQDEILRTVTGPSGRFEFNDVRPGQWTLRILKSGLPPYHAPETESRQIAIAPGESYELSVRILPQTRAVRILDSGSIEQIGSRK